MLTERFTALNGIVMVAAAVVARGTLAGEPKAAGLANAPMVSRAGDQFKIDFAADRETDVAVYIEDADGKVLRHLAAGALGNNAPPPLKPGSLKQSILWDGKDDEGRRVQAAKGLRVRVGLGLKATHHGWAFAETDNTGPNCIDSVSGLAVGADGKLYMLDKWSGLAWWLTNKIHVFGRDGSYEKTIKPFPSNLPLDRVKAAGVFINSFGFANPLIYRPEGTNLYPQEEVPQRPTITAGGRMIMATRSCAASRAG